MKRQQQFKGQEMTRWKRLEIITLKTQQGKRVRILITENDWKVEKTVKDEI